MTLNLRGFLVTAMAATVLSNSLAALEPRIVKPALDDSGVVVADLVLTDKPYGADPTGKKDTTAILQRAINDLAEAGACRQYPALRHHRRGCQDRHTL